MNKILTKELVNGSKKLTFQHYIGALPNPDKVLKRAGKTIEAYRDLKNDPHVWSCIQSRRAGALLRKLKVKIGKSTEEMLDFVEHAFSRIDSRHLVRDISESMLFGFQPIEILWEETKFKGQKVTIPKALPSKPQEWFVFSSEGKLMQHTKKGLREIPEYNVLPVVFENSYYNPYGEALLSKCYWPVTFKNGGLRFWINFMERYGMPVMVGTFERGASSEEADRLLTQLSNMKEDSVIVTPHDISVSFEEANKSSSVKLYSEMIAHCNSEISKALLSQTLTTEIMGGSKAASETHFKIRKEIVASDVEFLEKWLNKLVEIICWVNFGKCEVPRISMEEEEGQR